jgi:hypothetical protein
LFDMDDTGITGFKPYTPYSTDVNQYVAGFSPLQQSAQQATAGLQTPGQYGAATGLAGASGLGALGLAGQATGAGQQYAQNVTDPARMQAFMSPYQQGVTDVAKNAAVREAQIAQNTQNLGASRQGTYGGARQALMQGERERNLLANLSNIQAQGSQAAYDRALQSQQFGSTLGMQGLQAGMQGYGQAGQAASTLGQLGGQQLGAQKEIIGLQNQMGGQQQAQEQSKINQAIQDYAIQQQYPLMQLGFMSNMLRGLPMQAQTTQLYQAQPSTLQQGIGLAGAAGTLFGGGRAEGGAIKMAEGGITSVPGYKYGKLISEPKLEGMADNLSVQQLVERMKDPALTPGEREVFQEALAAKQKTAARSQGIAAAGGGLFNTMGYAGGGILAFADEGLVNSGIDPETGEPYKTVDPINRFSEYMNPFSGKGGFGYIARDGKSIEEYYNERSKAPPATEADRKAQAQMEVQDIEGSSAKNPTIRTTQAPAPKTPGNAPTGPSAGPTTVKGLEAYMAEQERLMGPNTGNEGLNAKIAERLASMDKLKDRDERAAMRRAFVEFGTKPALGGLLQAATGAVGTYGDASDAARKVREGMDLELTKMQADIKKGERAEKRGNLDAASKSYENAENRQLKIAEMENQLKAAQISASGAQAANNLKREEKAAIKADLTKSLGREPTMAEILNAYTKATSVADDSADARLRVAANTAYQKWEAGIVLDPNFRELQKKASKGDEAAAAKIEELKAAKRKQINAEIMGTQQAPQGTPAGGGGNLVQNKDGSFNYVPR